MMFLEDGKGVWKRYEDLPWKEYLHLERDKFEELLNLMMESHPDHELTDWLKRGYCMNNGDSTISVGSLSGRKTLNWQFNHFCLLYTSPSPRDLSTSRMPSSA